MKINHTFVVCAYKESRYLEKCIESLIAQKMKSNIIITTSTPNARIEDIAHKYNIPLYVNPVALGIASDWNYGISKAITRYVTLAHQDDLYLPDYGEECMKAITRYENSLIAFTDYGEKRDDKVVLSNKLLKIKRVMLFPLRLKLFARVKWIRRRCISLGNPICCPSVTYDMKNLSDDLFEIGMKSNIDWQAWEVLSRKKGAFVYVPKILMYHRIHGESETSRVIGDDARGQEDYTMFCKFWPRFIAKKLSKAYSKSEDSNNL